MIGVAGSAQIGRRVGPSAPSDLIGELEEILGRENVRHDPLQRRLFVKDAGMRSGSAPEVVTFPATREEAVAVVAAAHRRGLPLITRGTGTGLAGGAVPDGGVIVVTTRLNRIGEIDPDAGTVWVEPGVLNLDLSRRTSRWGLHFAPDPASQAACTIGGNVAVNAGGPHGLAEGSTADHVLAVEMIDRGGTVTLLGGAAPDPAGLDLRAVIVGSEGTLGLITRILVRLTRDPPTVRTLLMGFAGVDAAAAAVSEMIASGLIPAALELMDRRLVEIVERFAGAGYPTDAGAVLLAEVTGHRATVEAQAAMVADVARGHGASPVRIAADEKERDLLWKGRRSALAALVQIAPNYYIHDIVVPRNRLPGVVSELYQIADRHRLEMVVFGHAGDGNLHPTFAFDSSDPAQVRRVEAAGAEIVGVSVDNSGVLSGEHGIGIEKRRFMPLFFDPVDLDAQQRVRDAFDPDHLFNPDKVLPAESGYVSPEPISLVPEVRSLLAPFTTDPPEGAPAGEFVVAPRSLEDVATILRAATAAGLVVLPWGGGSHQGYGGGVAPDIVVVTRLLDRVVEWRPEDLVVVVEAGVRIVDLEDRLLGERGQTAVLPERPGVATVGGCVAAGASGWRRLRFGPTRNRVIEATLCTGDGRVVRNGARVVKNATGYDLARLAAGSLGSLGVIGRVALRLWPRPEAAATVVVADPEAALQTVHRPWAVVESDGEARVFLGGTRAEVEAQAEALGGDTSEGHRWPEAVTNRVRFLLRVPPADTRRAVERVPASATYRAAFGVGEIAIGFDAVEGIDLDGLRAWAEGRDGELVVTAGADALGRHFDPWGAPPPSLGLQRRVKAAFDPAGVMVPGRLPGGL